MSLINDALKKVRNQSAMRTEPIESASSAHPAPHNNYGNRSLSPSLLPWMIITAFITVLAVTCAILAMVIFYQSSPTEPEANHAGSESAVAVDNPKLEEQETPSVPAAATHPQATDSASFLRAPSAADRIETLDDVGTPSAAVVHWLAESTISGVRLAGQQSRVMLNGRTYRIGETVHFELGIVVRAIQESRVLFEDTQGLRYVKHF